MPPTTNNNETDSGGTWSTVFDNMSLFTCWYWSGSVWMCFALGQWLWIWAACWWELPACLLVQSLHGLQELQPGTKLLQQHWVCKLTAHLSAFSLSLSLSLGRCRFKHRFNLTGTEWDASPREAPAHNLAPACLLKVCTHKTLRHAWKQSCKRHSLLDKS